jgi:oxalate decarboxylase/phosphoglucose isomerase-like protein (cupin superfamily)
MVERSIIREEPMGSKKRSREQALEKIAEDKDAVDAVTLDPDSEDAYPTAAAHPEEMKGSVELRITKHVTLKATARATPAGLVGAAMLLAAIMIPIMWTKRVR